MILILNHKEETAKEIPIGDKITTIGTAPDSDIIIQNNTANGILANIYPEGRDYRVSKISADADLRINGKKTKESIIRNGDLIEISGSKMIFLKKIQREKAAQINGYKMRALSAVSDFNEQLTTALNTEALLKSLMDSVITMTRAETGFLVLVEGGRLILKAGTGMANSNGQDNLSILSDTIIAKVVREKKSIIVSDAMGDNEYRNAESVINLHLRSVMCVPLIVKEKMLGMIYLGSQKVENLFSISDLEMLKIFASEAALLLYNAILLDELRRENARLLDKIETSRFGALIGDSGAIQNVFREISKCAPLTAPVLILGENGTEKETAAMEIHSRSGRKGQFATFKASLYNEVQMDIELFGYARDSMPGALYAKRGKGQLCKGGTVYIEDAEIIPKTVQSKLLRIILDNLVTRLGSGTPERVDLRLIFSCRDIEYAVKTGEFNNDLYTRLLPCSITIPPLRTRDGDIELLSKHFLLTHGGQANKKILGFSHEAITRIKNYNWPGNVAELESRVKRALMICEGEFITAEDLELGS